MAAKPIAMGKVIEALPNLTFRVQLDSGNTIIAFLAGKLKINKIRVAVGDSVEVELDPYGGAATNRIVFRRR